MLARKHAFGCKGDVAGGVRFTDNDSVASVAGQSVVLQSLETRAQRFLPASSANGITALAISPSCKLIAIAERTSDRPLISIFSIHSLKRRIDLDKPEQSTRSFVSMSFSSDGKLLAALASQPSFPLVVYQWEKNQVLCSVSSVLSATPKYSPQVLFHPHDATCISLVGQNTFRLFKCANNVLKQQASPVGKRDPQSYICHTWVGEDKGCIVAASENGELVLVENNEFKSTLQGHSYGLQIHCITSFSKGFICGVDQGSILVYERESNSERKLFRKTRSLSMDESATQPLAAITALSLSPSEDTLALATRNNQLLSVSLSSTDISKSSNATAPSGNGGSDNECGLLKHLTQPFHSASISGLDTSIRKPWVATCGHDCTVRIWDYENKICELSKASAEEAFSVALHPSGFMVLVGFADKLRLMSVLMEDIVTLKEFGIKACKECNFSNGGHLFAAVNGNTIHLYKTYTYENIGNLRGHNGKVRSVHWTIDDARVVSAGMDGAVYQWRIDNLNRESDSLMKGCDYKCVVSSPNDRSIYAVGSYKKLVEIVDGQIKDEHDTDAVITQLALPKTSQVLLAGTEHGCIRSYKLPLNGEYSEIFAHNSKVTKLRMSFDNNDVFSTGDDGVLMSFELQSNEGNVEPRRDKGSVVQRDDVLVRKTEIEEKNSRMQELEQQVNEFQSHNEYQQRLRETKYNEMVKEIRDKYAGEVESERQKLENLHKDKDNLEMEYEEKKRQAEEHYKQQLAKTESEYDQKVKAEVERYQKLQKEKEQLNDQWEVKVAGLQESHKKAVASLTEDYEKQLADERQTMSRLQEEKDEAQRVFEETKRQLEEDADREIEELKERYDHRLGQEREASLRLKGENGVMKEKFNDLKNEIQAQKDEVSKQHEEKRKLESERENLQKDIKFLKKEISERDETISDEEKQVVDLKKKNQELEKYKFVLDHKIKELEKQVDPKDSEIASMKSQMKDMDNQMQRYYENNSALDLSISDLKKKLDGEQKERRKQQMQIADKRKIIEQFQHDLQEAVQNIQNPTKLKESMKKLYNKHSVQRSEKEHLDEDMQRKYLRQREYLEKTVESLKRKLQKNGEMHKADNGKAAEEISQLLGEINELKRENKALKERERAGHAPSGERQRQQSRSSQSEQQSSAKQQQRLPRSRRQSPAPHLQQHTKQLTQQGHQDNGELTR